MRITVRKKILTIIMMLILMISMLFSTSFMVDADYTYNTTGFYDFTETVIVGERVDIRLRELFHCVNNYYYGYKLRLYSNRGLYMPSGELMSVTEYIQNGDFDIYFQKDLPGRYTTTINYINAQGYFSGCSRINIDVKAAITNAASDITSEEAILNGRFNALNEATAVTFEYGTDTNYGSTAEAEGGPFTGGNPETANASVSGLTPNTTYHYRIVTQNSKGINYGEDMTFKTLLSLPGYIINESGAIVAASGVTLNAEVNANNSDTTVTFEYGADEGYGNMIPAQQNPVTGAEDTPVSVVIEGLEQNTTYHYRIKCENEAGIVLSDDFTFDTPYFADMPTAFAVVNNGTIKKNAAITLSSEEGAEIYYTTAVNDDTPGIPSMATSAHVSNGGVIILPQLAPGDELKIKAVAAVPGKGDSLAADISYNVQPQTMLTITGITVNDKEYNGNTNASADFSAAELEGITEGDSVELSGDPSAAFATPSAGDNKGIVISGYSLTGPDADYYYVDTTIPTTASVTKKVLEIGTITISDKQYDGTTAATAASIPMVGAAGSDEVYGNTALAEAVYSTDTGGKDKPVNVSNIQLAGEDADNYYLTSTAAAAIGNILPKTLSVNIAIAERIYDGTEAAAITGVSLVGVVGEDDVTVDHSTATAAFDNAAFGNDKLVTVTGLMLGGSDKNNYTMAASLSTRGNILPLGTVGIPGAVGLTANIHSGTRVTLTAEGYPDADVYYAIYESGSPIHPDRSSSSVTNGGSITITGEAGKAYYLEAIAAQEGYVDSGAYIAGFTILQKPVLSVAGASATDKDYDGTDLAVINAGTLSEAGVPGANDVRIDTSSIRGHFLDKNVGEDRTVTVSGYALTGADAEYYELLAPTAFTADIKVKEIAVESIVINDKVYDGTAAADISDITLSWKAAGDDTYVDIDAASAGFTNADYGNNKIVNVTGLQLGGADAGNYRLSSTAASTTGNILPAGTAAAPSVNLPADSLLSGTHIALSTTTEGASIYYTLDGSEPNRSSSVYTAPILIAGNPGVSVTVKAVAVKAGMVDSVIMTKQYTIAEPGSLIINAIPGNKEVTLSWAAIPEAVSYSVFDGEGNYLGNGVPSAEGTYRYTVSGLTNGMLYTYTVKAIDTEGRITNSSQSAATPRTVPGVPTNVNAAAGNGFVTVSFKAPADNGGSPITGYILKSNPGEVTVSGTDTAITVRGLINGTVYSFKVCAINSAGYGAESLPSNSVTYFKAASADSEGSGSRQSTPVNTGNGTDSQNNRTSGNLGTAITTTAGSRTITTFTVDLGRLAQNLENGRTGGVVTIDINSEADRVIGLLTGDMVRNMENKQAVLEVTTGAASYKLPAKEINIDGVLSQLGSNAELKDIKVNVEISKPSEEFVKVVEDSAGEGNFTIVVPPIEFNVTCTHNGRTVSVSTFNSFVERTIAIPDGVDPAKITTGVVIESDGTVRHVPTRIIVIDGRYYARINSLTNSTYLVIEHSADFKDAAGHWAKEAIGEMGSRMIIGGVGNELFEPDKEITRAEFTAIVGRALGLKPGTGENPYIDVKPSEWYCDYIKTAYEYKLVSGGTDKFHPMDSITREQAMVILSRAMSITGLENTMEKEQAEKLLGSFKDSYEVSSYAIEGIADCVKAGIVTGKAGRIASEDNITRAEAAVMIQRMLKNLNLI